MNYSKSIFRFKDNNFIKKTSVGKSANIIKQKVNKQEEMLKIHRRNMRLNINTDKVVDKLLNLCY